VIRDCSCRSQLKATLQIEREEAAKNIRALEERNLHLSVSLREVSEAEEHSMRTIRELQAERAALDSTSSSLLVIPGGVQPPPPGFVSQAEFDALDEAYQELHSKLERVWAERDEAIEKLEMLTGRVRRG
jgi:DNA repair exonuclease SbcCD ATPase subunit